MLKWVIYLVVATAANSGTPQVTVSTLPQAYSNLQECRKAAARVVWITDNTPFPWADGKTEKPVEKPGFPITGTRTTADCIPVR